jgi:tRNA 2-thiouridine synthesizing protein A
MLQAWRQFRKVLPGDRIRSRDTAGTGQIQSKRKFPETGNISNRSNLFNQRGEMMTTDELRTLKIGKLVDARGTACPGPLLEARRSIGECPIGGVMEIQSSDTDTAETVQRWCKKMGFDYLGVVENDGFWSIYFRRTK